MYLPPNTRAVRTVWLMNELGLDYELERFTLGEKAMRSPEYLAVNPNGRVPTLDDGEVRMSESTAIAQYLVARYGDGSLARSPESPEFPAYLQWLHYAEGMIMPPINAYVVETILLPPDRRSETHADTALRASSTAPWAGPRPVSKGGRISWGRSAPPTRSPAMPASCRRSSASTFPTSPISGPIMNASSPAPPSRRRGTPDRVA